jgi:MurNAc alpha-1-phosphate uridylyltransferase
MKAMILAAGRGERMRPLTDRAPKPLLLAGGKPLIVHLIEGLRREGFCDLVINHAYLPQQLVSVLGDGRRLGVRIRYSAEPQQALDTGGGILNALPLLGNSPFLVVNGDIWTDYPFRRLAKEPAHLAHLVMVDNPRHHPEGDFAVIDGKIDSRGCSRLTFGGIGVYRCDLFAGQGRSRFPLAPLLREAAMRGEVSAEYYGGQWIDVGTPQRLNELDARLRRAPVT